jgi:hypothetical protein
MRAVRFTGADVFVSIVLVLLIGTFTVAQVQNANEGANRVKCGDNLRLIGHALLFYGNDNRGAYPRTYADRNDNPTPTWGTPYEGDAKLGPRDRKKADPFHAKDSDVVPKPNDVTAALFLLLRTQDIRSDAFVCPSSGNEPFTYGGKENSAPNWTNWPGNKGLAEHLSYSYQNPYPGRAAIKNGFSLNIAIGELFAVAADMNPGVDALITVTLDAGQAAVRVGNSPNHGGDGQNVLYGDGHIEWQVSPYVGTARDNIYTYGNSGPPYKNAAGDGIVGGPVGANDSILLPTAKDLGVVDANGQLTETVRKRRQSVAPDIK